MSREGGGQSPARRGAAALCCSSPEDAWKEAAAVNKLFIRLFGDVLEKAESQKEEKLSLCRSDGVFKQARLLWRRFKSVLWRLP